MLILRFHLTTESTIWKVKEDLVNNRCNDWVWFNWTHLSLSKWSYNEHLEYNPSACQFPLQLLMTWGKLLQCPTVFFIINLLYKSETINIKDFITYISINEYILYSEYNFNATFYAIMIQLIILRNKFKESNKHK